ncbi:MAG: type I-E CRISPR-associated protein Cse1/CasA [Deltaproteobacteria bacterium]
MRRTERVIDVDVRQPGQRPGELLVVLFLFGVEAEVLQHQELSGLQRLGGGFHLGWLDALTWRSRRIELNVTEGMVTGWIRAVGQGLAEGAPRDPMVSWVEREKRGWVPVGIDPDRAFWRESHALFETSKQSTFGVERPAALRMLASPQARAIVDPERRYTIDVLGIASDQARIEAMRADRVTVVARLLSEPESGEAVREAIDLLTKLSRELRGALWLYAARALAPGARSPDKKDIERLVNSLGAEPTFWAACEAHFATFLDTLAVKPAAARTELFGAGRRTTEDCFHRASTALGDNARSLKAGALAEKHLRYKLLELMATASNMTQAVVGVNP